MESGNDAVRQWAGPGRQVAAAFNAIEIIIVVGAGLALLNTLAISVIDSSVRNETRSTAIGLMDGISSEIFSKVGPAAPTPSERSL